MPFDFTGEEAKLYPSTFEESKQITRRVRESLAVNYSIYNPKHIVEYFKAYIYQPFRDFEQEEMWLLLCNNRSIVTHDIQLYVGTINQIPMRPAEVFRDAFRYNAASIAISHVHPSGVATPSDADLKVTEKLVALGKELDMPILDHVIVGREECTSFAMNGIGGF